MSTLTITRHQEDNESKATSSLFLVKMITKLEMKKKMQPKSHPTEIETATPPIQKSCDISQWFLSKNSVIKES